MRKLLLFLFILCGINSAIAVEKIGVISDALLIRATPYNTYYRTPDFMVQDVIDILNKNPNIQVVPLSDVRKVLLRNRITSTDMAYLQNIDQGYDLNFIFLKKLANLIGVKKLVVITSSVDIQRDFLKPTLWNSLNIAGFDTVNPTHRMNVYSALVDCNSQSVLWENVYAKNIRNNKMKNLDTTISQNFEGIMRQKQYSKYISPEIAYNVSGVLYPRSVQPVEYVNNFEGFVMATNKKMRVGSDKKLYNTNYIKEKFEQMNDDKLLKQEQKMLEKQRKEAEKVFKQEAQMINVDYKPQKNNNEVIFKEEAKFKSKKQKEKPAWLAL